MSLQRPAGSTATNVAGKAQTPTKMQPPTTASTIATPDSPQVQTLPPTPPTKQSPPPTPDASPNSQKIPPLIRSTAVQRWDDDENRVVVSKTIFKKIFSMAWSPPCSAYGLFLTLDSALPEGTVVSCTQPFRFLLWVWSLLQSEHIDECWKFHRNDGDSSGSREGSY